MKTHYSDYVRYCMRCYARNPHPKFRTEVEKLNWYACENTLKGFTDSERDILLDIYREDTGTIPDNIYRVSVDLNIKLKTIWNLLIKLEQEFAKRRNLI